MSAPADNRPAMPAASEIKQAYNAYTLATAIRNAKVACILVFFLMPLGAAMDIFVYHDQAPYFFKLRLLSSVGAAVVFLALRIPGLSDRQYRVLCAGWYIVPAFFISCMIETAGGIKSTYYAGLNLVILAISSVIQASVMESVVAVTLVFTMYILACTFSSHEATLDAVANNAFFMFCTAAEVITGNFFFNRLRFREFMLRFELDQNRKMLEEGNKKLKELDEVKSRFFANISHELRTPLTLLLAPLESLLHRFNKPMDADARNLLSTMHANGMRLLKLINDLLDLVRLESGVMVVKKESVEVAGFVKGLSSSARQVADDKRLKLLTHVDEELGCVATDRDKLEKIVLNLVFNALKFTPAGGTVELRAEKQGEEFVVIVRDTGMGISAKNLPHVFDRFWQADDSARRKYQGVGIGLALVKELVEVQGGKVSVASEEGKGTTFTIRLPYEKAESAGEKKTAEEPATSTTPVAAAPADATVSSQEWLGNLYRRAELFPAMTPVQESVRQVETGRNGHNRPSLLVADDEPDMLRFLKSQLETHYRVLEAVDGQQAVDKAGQFLPDIILLDMMMPEKDGLQACREIRARNSTQTIPVILLTARADEETKLKALEAGASDFLSKPFSTTELHVRIKNLVDSHQYQNKLSKQNQVLESTIEQLKETETMLVQTEKMVSLGRMSAGIIHEINNPLNYATTGLYSLRNKAKKMDAEERAEYEEILHDVEEGIGRVKSIVTDLKTFTHPDMEQVDIVEAGPIVGSALRFLSNEWKNKVAIEQHVANQLAIRANRNKLLQVIVNLLQNSLDAIRHKQFAAEEKPTIWIEGALENNNTVLTIRDNGEGIDKDALDKIFDPFFTTKDVGEGMGLGLTICYRIVQEYEGHISVRSERGKFCEFKLEFPALAPSEATIKT